MRPAPVVKSAVPDVPQSLFLLRLAAAMPYMRAMGRPSRKLTNLIAKTDRKDARSRKPGAKGKRWKKAIAQYKPIVDGTGDGRPVARKNVAEEDEPEAPSAAAS